MQERDHILAHPTPTSVRRAADEIHGRGPHQAQSKVMAFQSTSGSRTGFLLSLWSLTSGEYLGLSCRLRASLGHGLHAC